MRSDDNENWLFYTENWQSSKDKCCKMYYGRFALNDDEYFELVTEYTYETLIGKFISTSKNVRGNKNLFFLDKLLKKISRIGVDDALTHLLDLQAPHKNKSPGDKLNSGAIRMACADLIEALLSFRDFFELEFSIDKFEYYTIFFRYAEVQEIIEKHLDNLYYDQDRVTELYVIKSKISKLKQEPFTLFKHRINSTEDIEGIEKEDIEGIEKEDSGEFHFFKSHISEYEKWVQSKIDFYSSKLIVSCSKQQLRAGIESLIKSNDFFDIEDITSFVNNEFEILSGDEDKRTRLNDYVVKIGNKQVAKPIIMFFTLLHEYKVIDNKTKTINWILKIFGEYEGFSKHSVKHFLMTKSALESYSKVEIRKVKRIFME